MTNDRNFKEKVALVEEYIESSEQADLVRSALFSKLTREQAIEYGRALGENEAERRGETGDEKEVRVRRAQAYALWEFEGRVAGSEHLKEFGVPTGLTGSLDRASFGRLLKKDRK